MIWNFDLDFFVYIVFCKYLVVREDIVIIFIFRLFEF